MQTNKSLGQHWLYDEASLQAMCLAAKLNKDDNVLEVGPGLGTLTDKLVKAAYQVTAVEFDAKLASELKKTLIAKNLKIVNQDILKFNLNDMPPNYKVVANIPYYLTSKLVRVLSESENPPISVTLLIQKEVAERLTSKPGKMSILAVTAQMYFEPFLKNVVKAELFTPPPKIDSQIIHLERRSKPLFYGMDSDYLFRVVKAGFVNRRKTLLNSLSAGMHYDKKTTEEILQNIDINPKLRPQDLSLQEWIKLASEFDRR